MSGSPYPQVDVKAVAITRGDAILTIFNARWGAFTLPMSKTRTWPDERAASKIHEEDPSKAALRAAAEALGRPLGPHEVLRPLVLHTLPPYNRSDRDGAWKSYHIEVFQLELPVDETPRPLGGLPMAWMTLEEMETLKPVASTAIRIAGAMRAASILPDGR